MTNSRELNRDRVEQYLLGLQAQIIAALEAEESGVSFLVDDWQRDAASGGVGNGYGRTRVLAEGAVFERAGVNFSSVSGDSLPAAATAKRPELVGRAFTAMGVSLVLHPWNPHAPTTHLNVRYFEATAEGAPPIWWFGGGFDLTPYYGYDEDARHWHRTAQDACAVLGDDAYPKYKQWCDEYFYLKHRNEPRGIGGLFFDDLNSPDFDTSFGFMQSVGNHFLPAYLPILQRRRDQAYDEAQRQWQLLRRGRYVEFNLVWDRGTLFGLQTGGRTESILMSMPPKVSWAYDHQPEPGTPEAELLERFLKPRDWLHGRSGLPVQRY